jgi:hypothetical protein
MRYDLPENVINQYRFLTPFVSLKRVFVVENQNLFSYFVNLKKKQIDNK